MGQVVGIWERQRDKTKIECYQISENKIKGTYANGESFIYIIDSMTITRKENSNFSGQYDGDSVITWNNGSTWKKQRELNAKSSNRTKNILKPCFETLFYILQQNIQLKMSNSFHIVQITVKGRCSMNLSDYGNVNVTIH